MKYRLTVVLFLFARFAGFGQTRFVFERAEMGSPFTLTFFADDSVRAGMAADAAFHLADSLNAILSDYIDSSEINQLSACSGSGRWMRVSPPLWDILSASMDAAVASRGAYDVTIGPVVRLWRVARKTRVMPSSDSLRSALDRSGYRYMRLDMVLHSVLLEKPGMRLDIGGLGKGFVAQRALGVLAAYGFSQAMVNAGGKIVTGAAPPGRKGWLIGINAPGEKAELMPRLLSLEQMAVATSGDIYQYVEIDGKRYSHIVNPRTGIGLTRRRNVTVIAADGTLADWLATACSILHWRRALRLVRKYPGAALFVTERRKNIIRASASPNFWNYLNNPATAGISAQFSNLLNHHQLKHRTL